VDFHAVMELLGKDDLDALPTVPGIMLADVGKLAELEVKYLKASPEIKARISKSIERGPIGALVKRANGYKCQLCYALGRADWLQEKERRALCRGHHVMPVSRQQIGSLAASNVMTLCANHHREVHFGCAEIMIGERTFTVAIDGKTIEIARFCMPVAVAPPTGKPPQHRASRPCSAPNLVGVQAARADARSSLLRHRSNRPQLITWP
jgi:hypothetical protein